MGRYSKSYSNYVLRKRHQNLDGTSTIFERDWGTLGERHVIESGKKKIYADSNFLFTDNTRFGAKYRNNTGEWSDPYTKEALGDKIDNTVNDTSLLSDSNDIRDYAYYGSAVDLVRASVENIIKWFPGRFWSTDRYISKYNETEDKWIYLKSIISDGHHNYIENFTDNSDECSLYVVANPFTIDFYNTNIVLGKYDNALRNMPFSFKQYELNGGRIREWNVWIKPYSDCDQDYDIKYDVDFKYEEGNTIKSGHLYGITMSKSIVWVSTVEFMNVQPQHSVIDEYFNTLDGFERKLLNRESSPIYTTKLITPIPYGNNNPNYNYIERSYTWPSDDYCITVDSVGFENYFNSLYNLATLMDELWCNNIWRSMTHEAITNFDWTYTREYIEGEEEENILGGTRMEGVLKIWGRCFDDLKRYIDNISLKNCITYENNDWNLANAELSDKAELLGWEVYSTKSNKYDNIYLTNDFIEDYIGKLDQDDRWDCSESNNDGCGATVSYEKWYNSKNPEQVSQNSVDNDFMRRLVLSSAEILRSKGTKQAIEMVFAMFGIGNHDENNPEIEFEEKYYSVTPKKRDDVFPFYRLNVAPDEGEGIVYERKDYDSLIEYLENEPISSDSPEHIGVNGFFYDLITNMTVGDVCEYLIYMKSAALNYEDDEFSGTPIKDVYINNEHYIVPYFTQDRIYDGEVQFETKGGWGKKCTEEDDIEELKKQEYNYLETIPYMDIVQKVGGLLDVNPFQVGNKKIFYVMDLSDLSEFVETIPDNISHLFKLQDPDHPNVFSSWRNIPVDGNADPGYDIFNDVTPEDIKLAEYVDSLKLDNLGNNPHCGYSAYDLGDEYYQYLKMPFKHAVDNYGFSNINDTTIAEQFTFDVVEHTGDKIVNLIGDDTINYILPSKVLILKTVIYNDLYRQYLNDVIMKYVLQVIPSTTILILQEKEQEFTNGFYYTGVVDNEMSVDKCTRFDGDDVELDRLGDMTIILVPENTDVTLKFTSDGIESTVVECAEQPCLIEINNRVSGLPEGYKALMYYFRGINTSAARIILNKN